MVNKMTGLIVSYSLNYVEFLAPMYYFQKASDYHSSGVDKCLIHHV